MKGYYQEGVDQMFSISIWKDVYKLDGRQNSHTRKAIVSLRKVKK